jgi:hypothetical protein
MIERLISGGQTGVDRAALDAALEKGFPCGGWCPQGRRAEDGRIPPQYPLREMASPSYPPRTERNVLDSDGTLVLYRQRPDQGTGLTMRLAHKHGRPLLVVDLEKETPRQASARILEWSRAHGIAALNVAGPRASHDPEVYALALEVMRELLQRI